MHDEGHLRGATLRRPMNETFDVVIVGSGPAGATVAWELAQRGARCAVVEAGPWRDPDSFPLGGFEAMAELYRDMGASVVVGGALMPYVQGRMVGGSSPINGAICWRTPRDVHEAWCAADGALRDALPWDALERHTDRIEARLNVRPTDPAVAGPKNDLLARGAEALGLEHRPIRRNVQGCEGLGRCLQGCPRGHKRSVDATLLRDALQLGATVLSDTEVQAILVEGGRAVGVEALTEGGARVRLLARHAVVLAASAVQTPALLLRSGVTHGPVGHHFQCHPGVSLAGRFPQPIRMWEGATQGHEVIGLRHEGLKFEALGFGPSLLAGRLDGVGRAFSANLEQLDRWLDWGVAVRATAQGRVRLVRGRAVVQFTPSAEDVRRFRRGVRVMGEMMFAAGAEEVLPGIKGFDARVTGLDPLKRLEADGPTRPSAYKAAITHMFGTARMGSDPERSVVRPDFRHHTVAALYVADSSVFPTNLGVNPQIPIMAMAALCAARVARQVPVSPRVNGVKRPHLNGSSHRRAAPATPIAAAQLPLFPDAPAPDPERQPDPLTLADLMRMTPPQLERIMRRGHPIPREQLDDTRYLGVDLSLPPLMRRLLWHTFSKTFHRDPATDVLRGWNIRLVQLGVDAPIVPMTDRRGRPVTFGHYHVADAANERFPSGWRGADYLNYGCAGNPLYDPARFTASPLVAVNPGSAKLLLGQEVFRLGQSLLSAPLYWALQYEGPLREVIPPPNLR